MLTAAKITQHINEKSTQHKKVTLLVFGVSKAEILSLIVVRLRKQKQTLILMWTV